ncbi:MBL fold metallo-hydrolase [Chloroflexota bacterium]
MNVSFLGAHNCESQNTKLVSLLIDNVLVLDAGGLASSLSFPAQRRIKAILLTHQHYDHIRDVPAIAMNFYLFKESTNVYSTLPVYDILTSHLFNGELYPNFLERPQEKPTIKFTVIESHELEQIEGYSILAIPVNHSVPSVGYQITSADGKVVFYTGDTGPGLSSCWEQVSPQLLIIEVTSPSSFSDFAKESGHLTPELLKQEMVIFREIKGYLPEVVAVHMNPALEREIDAEIAAVSDELGNRITIGSEGMRLYL